MGERNLTVDPFGDNVSSVSNIPGGSFTARHDLVKTCINALCVDAGLRVGCEVFGRSGTSSQSKPCRRRRT